MPDFPIGALQLNLLKQVLLVWGHLLHRFIDSILNNFAHFSITQFNFWLLQLLINLLVKDLIRKSDDPPPEQLFRLLI